MKLKMLLSIVLNLCLLGGSLLSQTTVEDWQKKTVADFPDIGIKDSEMNQKYIRRIQELRYSDPTFFKNNRWPYALAEQIKKPAIIPGVENVAPLVRPTSSSREEVEFIAATDVSAKAVKGRNIDTEGVIISAFQRALGAQGSFFVKLQPNLICEFSTATFIEKNRSNLPLAGGGMYYGRDALRFENGAVSVYGSRHSPSVGSLFGPNPQIKMGEILKKGETVTVRGRYEGDWAGQGGIGKDKILRDCTIIKTQPQ